MSIAKVQGGETLKTEFHGQTRNLVVFTTYHTKLFEAHLLVETINAELGTSLRIVSHKVADSEVTRKPGEYPSTFVTDTAIAYERPGTPFGKEVVFGDLFDYPKVVLRTGVYQGERNMALVASGFTSSDFKKDNRYIVLDIPESRWTPVPIPGDLEWYKPHTETGIPHGMLKTNKKNRNARRLLRFDGAHVGLVLRMGFVHHASDKRSVIAMYKPTFGTNVLAEVPDADVAIIRALIVSQTTARTTVELPVKVTELRDILAQFRKDLEMLGTTANEELLAAGRRLETMISANRMLGGKK